MSSQGAALRILTSELRCSFVSQLPEMAGELYSGGTHMRRYGWNKHTLEPYPESFPYIEHLEDYSDTRRLSSIESG